MSTDLTIFEVSAANAKLPAAFGVASKALTSELAAGVQAGFPVLSYRGKVWRMKKGDEEVKLTSPDTGDPLGSISVVLVAANPQLSKIYYAGEYEEGSSEAPDCYSVDGLRPDPSIEAPVSKLCKTCPKNVWGSKITKTGSKVKACADNRRVAVVFAEELALKGADADVYLLRIPGASLANLKVYAERVLGDKGWPFYAVVTRVGFDTDASFPKLTFRPIMPVPEKLASTVLEIRDAETVKTITSTAFEVEAGAEDTETPDSEPPTQEKVTPIRESEADNKNSARASTPTPAPAKAATPRTRSAAKPSHEAEAAAEEDATLVSNDDALRKLLGSLGD